MKATRPAVWIPKDDLGVSERRSEGHKSLAMGIFGSAMMGRFG